MKYLLAKSKFFFFLCALFLLSSCLVPKEIVEEKEIFNESIKENPLIKTHTITVDGDELFYAISGDPSKPSLIIIHGTPGSWEQYARYLIDENLLLNYQVIVIDRPGWGQSRLGGNRLIVNFSEQAKIIAALVSDLKRISGGKAVVLMGHSLGASIAPKVAMEYPELIDGLLLFAGTLDPDLASPRWFNNVAKFSLVNYLIGERLRQSNLEILALKKELEAMLGQWQSLRVKTIAVQGMKDKLVYPENIKFAETHLNPQISLTISLEDTGHLFPMRQRKSVADWATCVLQSVNLERLMCKGGI